MKAGWKVRLLGEVCVTIQDGAHESPKQLFDAPGDGRFLYITSKNIRNNYLDLANVSYVDGDFHGRIYPRCKPNVGDVLLTKDGANTGNVTLNTLDEPFSLLSSVCLIKTKQDVLQPAFLSYYIQSPDGLENITGQMTGAAIKRIILRDIKLAAIPLPPLPEQHRIVAILDEAFASIATAKANAEQNLQNARAFFESELEAVFSQRGAKWPIRTLDELCDQITDGTHNSPPYVEAGVPMLDSKHIQDGFVIDDTEPEKFISPATDVLLSKRCKPRTGDILVSSRGSIGKIAIVRDGQDFNIMGNMILIRLPVEICREFAAFYLLSQVAHIESIARGAAQKGLYLSQVRDYKIPLPAEAQQAQIGRQLDALFEETQCLASLYQRKLAALDELKKSLLHQAFSGQL